MPEALQAEESHLVDEEDAAARSLGRSGNVHVQLCVGMSHGIGGCIDAETSTGSE
jgi:hypothetical protein